MTSIESTTRRALFLRLFLAITLVLVPAAIIVTAPATAVADDSQEEARARFMEGREHFADSEYIEAAEKFLEAYELSDRSELLYNVGQAYRRAGALSRAEDYYQKYLNLQPNAANADEVVETIIEIQRAQAARLATLTVLTDPEGADIYVDNEDSPRCKSPCDIDFDPGVYVLRAERDGYFSNTAGVELAARQKAETGITLKEEPPGGGLHVRADVDGATLVANGDSHRVPTANPIELEAGPHDISVQWQGNRWDQEITIEPGEILHIFVPVGAAGGQAFSPLRASAVGLGGASIALAVAGALAGRQAQSTHLALQARQESFGQVDSALVESGRNQQAMANTLWLGSIVSLAAGAGLWTWDMMSSGTKESEKIEPTPEEDEKSGIDLL